LLNILTWYGVLMGVTWALAPLVALLCRGLPTHGAFLVRPLALIAVVYPVWLFVSLKAVSVSTRMLSLALARDRVSRHH
jgi:hypothetical protein